MEGDAGGEGGVGGDGEEEGRKGQGGVLLDKMMDDDGVRRG